MTVLEAVAQRLGRAFTWDGWHVGATDCEPPEPDKEWLTISDTTGDEVCIIVLRTDAGIFHGVRGPETLLEHRQVAEAYAARIVYLLNVYGLDAPAGGKGPSGDGSTLAE